MLANTATMKIEACENESYSFDERVAIMMFDGGLTEVQATIEAIKIFRELELKDVEVQKQTL